MSDPVAKFVRESRTVLSADAVELGTYVHVYEGTIEGVSERVRLFALAPDIENDAVKDAFERVAGEWHNPSSHPNIVTVHERGREPRPWVAVELVDGQPLDTVYADLTLRETRAVLTDVAEAIRNAGLYNTRHGNLTPKHVWVEWTQQGVSARVGDWGLRRACRHAAGEMHLTPFSPPEFVENPDTETDQSDVYGLGGLAYYATTGELPIQMGVSDAGLTDAITAGEITPPTEHNPTLPREIDDVLLQALAYDPRDRQQSAHGFKQAVTQAFPDSNELTIPATTPSEQQVQGQQPQAQPQQQPRQAQPRQTTSPPPESPQPRDGYEQTGGNRGATDGTESGGSFTRRASLGALGVAVLGIGGWQLFRNGDSNSAGTGISNSNSDPDSTGNGNSDGDDTGNGDGTDNPNSDGTGNGDDDGTGSGNSDDDGTGNGNSDGDGTGNGDGSSDPFGDGTLDFNVSPSVAQEDLQAQYTPIKEYLSEELGVTTEMRRATNYSAVIQALESGTSDVAETGPFAAALGSMSDSAEIILQRRGFGTWTYKSGIAIPKDSDIEELADLEGKTVAFTDRLSTSGTLFPLSILKTEGGLGIGGLPEGTDNGADFTADFVGSHPGSYETMVHGQADAAAFGGFVPDIVDDWGGNAKWLHLREGLPRAPIVVSAQLTDEEKRNVIDAFVDAPQEIYWGEDGEQATADDLWFNAVREVGVDEYQIVIDVANELDIGIEIFE